MRPLHMENVELEARVATILRTVYLPLIHVLFIFETLTFFALLLLLKRISG